MITGINANGGAVLFFSQLPTVAAETPDLLRDIAPKKFALAPLPCCSLLVPRLREIADSCADMLPLQPHESFESDIRACSTPRPRRSQDSARGRVDDPRGGAVE